MEDGELHDFSVSVRPSLLFQRYTNTYRVDIAFSRNTIGGRLERTAVDGEYIIVNDCPNFGNVEAFVSFKDPEDLVFAELEKTLLNRSGLRGYLARDDVQPGLDFWEKIATHIQRSVATFVIWTKNTVVQYESVLRELEIATEAAIPVVLLLERGVEAPAGFKAHRIEYVGFDAVRPSSQFAAATESVYERWRQTAGR